MSTQRARVVLAVRIGTQPLAVRGPGRASPAVWLAGFAPLAACLAMTHVAVFRLTPNAAGRPSVTSYAYGLFKKINTQIIWCDMNNLFHIS